jgi:hypothetical protein
MLRMMDSICLHYELQSILASACNFEQQRFATTDNGMRAAIPSSTTLAAHL